MTKEEYLKDRLNFIKRNSIYGIGVDKDKLKKITKELFKDCDKQKKTN